MSDNFEARLVRLETLISMQDQTIEDLNQVVIGQQKEIDRLLHERETIAESMSDGGGDASYANQRPPHY